ncbi:uncharacterized protein SAPINGB_P000155 [Magnusiomyces paraingens]|uniref:Uncharacterized protein n=1 Tax=Magnusiomyces paraingens TaxID=2606893 RepID=A0A5E8AXW9_9ASCO|nr:uncharacterized protein SAPINGB_P000155 [Saprochaete ingens]VVT43806.1 unnamed protein product [Saprochaete ingens]
MNLLRKFYDKKRDSRVSLSSSASTGSLRSIISLTHSASSVSLASSSGTTIRSSTDGVEKLSSSGSARGRGVYLHPRLAHSASAVCIGSGNHSGTTTGPRSARATNVISRRQSCMELESSTRKESGSSSSEENEIEEKEERTKIKEKKRRLVKELEIDTKHVFVSRYVAMQGVEDRMITPADVGGFLKSGDDGKYLAGYESSSSNSSSNNGNGSGYWSSNFGESDYEGEPAEAVRVSVSAVSGKLVNFGGFKEGDVRDSRCSNTVSVKSSELFPVKSMVNDNTTAVTATTTTTKLEAVKQARRRSFSLFGKTAKGLPAIRVPSPEPMIVLGSEAAATIRTKTNDDNNNNKPCDNSSSSSSSSSSSFAPHKRYGGLLRKWHSYTDFGALLGSSSSSASTASSSALMGGTGAPKGSSSINTKKGKSSAEEFPERICARDQQPMVVPKKQPQKKEMKSGETHALLCTGSLSHLLLSQPQKTAKMPHHHYRKLRHESIKVIPGPFLTQIYSPQTPVSKESGCDNLNNDDNTQETPKASTSVSAAAAAAAAAAAVVVATKASREMDGGQDPIGVVASTEAKQGPAAQREVPAVHEVTKAAVHFVAGAAVCSGTAKRPKQARRRRSPATATSVGEHKSTGRAHNRQKAQQQRTSVTCLFNSTSSSSPYYYNHHYHHLSHSYSTPNLLAFKMASSPGSIFLTNGTTSQAHAMTTTVLMSPLKEEQTPPPDSPLRPSSASEQRATMGIALAITSSQTIVSTEHFLHNHQYHRYSRCHLPPIDTCDTTSGVFQPFYTPLSTPVRPNHTISAQSSPGYYSTSSPGTATELSKKKPRGAQRAAKRVSQPSPIHAAGFWKQDQASTSSSTSLVASAPLLTPPGLGTPPLLYYSPSDIPLSTINSHEEQGHADNINDKNDADWSFCSRESHDTEPVSSSVPASTAVFAPGSGSGSATTTGSGSAPEITRTISKPRALPLPPINRPLPPIPTVTIAPATEPDSDNEDEVIITAVTVLGDQQSSSKRRASSRPARLKNLLRRGTPDEELTSSSSSSDDSCAIVSPPESPTVSTSPLHRLFAPRARTRSTSSGAASVVSLPLFRTSHGSAAVPQLPPLSGLSYQAQPMKSSSSGPIKPSAINIHNRRINQSSSRLSLAAVKTSVLSPLSPTFQLRFPRSATTTRCMVPQSSLPLDKPWKQQQQQQQQQQQLLLSPTNPMPTPMESQHSASSIFSYYAGHRDDLDENLFDQEEEEEDDNSYSETSSPQELHGGHQDHHLLLPHNSNKLNTTPVTALFSPTTTKRRSISNPLPLKTLSPAKALTVITGRYGIIRHTTHGPPSACAFEETDVWAQYYLARDEAGELDYWDDYEDGSVARVLGNVVYI